VNVFILNLAVGDLVVFFIAMPSDILFAVVGQWVLGPVACKLAGYSYVMAMASTTFLLTAMSMDRYQVRVTSTFSDFFALILIKRAFNLGLYIDV